MLLAGLSGGIAALQQSVDRAGRSLGRRGSRLRYFDRRRFSRRLHDKKFLHLRGLRRGQLFVRIQVAQKYSRARTRGLAIIASIHSPFSRACQLPKLSI